MINKVSNLKDTEEGSNQEETPLEDSVVEEQLSIASPWQLMWWRLRRHKLAMFSGVIIIMFYLIAIFCEFVAPYDPHSRISELQYAPAQVIHFIDREGNFSVQPFVYKFVRERDPETLRWTYEPDFSQKYYLSFFERGEPYKLWGRFESNLHLIGFDATATESEEVALSLFGRDSLGRDVFSRVIYGTRVSLSIGLIGVVLSLSLGLVLGGVSGYYGGVVDLIIERVIEFLRSLPTIPLWMGLAAAIPAAWSPLQIYFAITVILSLIGWTTLARVVRGRFLSLREEDFVMAARLGGVSEIRIILGHMMPSFLSHIIASVTLAIPGMILSETSLSFLGLGLRPPAISWGVLLQDAQNVRSVALAPWLLLPGLFVVISILAFNFLGDGLRDAADPYAN